MSCQQILSFPSPGVFASAIWNPTNSSELKVQAFKFISDINNDLFSQEVLNGIARIYLCDSNDDLIVRIGSISMFGPILIKRSFVEASSSDSSIDKIRRLLTILPKDIVSKGLDLIRSRLPDLALDVPNIKEKFQVFTDALQSS